MAAVAKKRAVSLTPKGDEAAAPVVKRDIFINPLVMDLNVPSSKKIVSFLQSKLAKHNR